MPSSSEKTLPLQDGAPKRTVTSVHLHLPVPPSANNLFFNLPHGGRAETKEYRSWQDAATWRLKAQRPAPLIEGPVHIKIEVPYNARRDLSNYLKPIEDFLVSRRVIKDDRAKYVRRIVLEWGEQKSDDALVTVLVIGAGT